MSSIMLVIHAVESSASLALSEVCESVPSSLLAHTKLAISTTFPPLFPISNLILYALPMK
jgi:hypothetical protein